MKGRLRFDPAHFDYGPASISVRRLLLGFAEIEWFVPPARPDARERARSLFELHQTLAHARLPVEFPEDIVVTFDSGDYGAFAALCARARKSGSGWDWKFEGLKALSAAPASTGGGVGEGSGAAFDAHRASRSARTAALIPAPP